MNRNIRLAFVLLGNLAIAACGADKPASEGSVQERRSVRGKNSSYSVHYLITDTRRAGEEGTKVHKVVTATDLTRHELNVAACWNWAHQAIGARICHEVRGYRRDPVRPEDNDSGVTVKTPRVLVTPRGPSPL
jgi:hypothetical protein